jgi:hypothetical protein
VPLLGIYPSMQALGAQLFVLALVVLAFRAARRGGTAQPA